MKQLANAPPFPTPTDIITCFSAGLTAEAFFWGFVVDIVATSGPSTRQAVSEGAVDDNTDGLPHGQQPKEPPARKSRRR